jgi:hypothetical protein
VKKKTVSPSKVKYDKSHPVVNIRVNPALKEDLEMLRCDAGKSSGISCVRHSVNRNNLPIIK